MTRFNDCKHSTRTRAAAASSRTFHDAPEALVPLDGRRHAWHLPPQCDQLLQEDAQASEKEYDSFLPSYFT